MSGARGGALRDRLVALAGFAAVTVTLASLAQLPEVRIAAGVIAFDALAAAVAHRGDRWTAHGITLAGFPVIDWFLVPPRFGFGVPSPVDLGIMVAYALVGMLTNELLVRLRAARDLAESRAVAIEGLSRERVALEAQLARGRVLEEARRLEAMLLASITHDLRTPLSTLAMLAGPGSLLPPPEALARVEAEVRRMDDYLRALRRLGADGTAARPLLLETHDVATLVQAVLDASAAALRAHPVRPFLDGGQAAAPRVRCDFPLAQSILANLLGNAARYAPAGTPIDVVVECAGRAEVHLVVADRGPGLAPGEEETVFQPLQRGAARSRDDGGTGLGLAIARTFARAMRGDLRYRPRAGGGAEFVLVLPAAP